MIQRSTLLLSTLTHCGNPDKRIIKDTNDFLPKLKNLKKVPNNAITADVVGLYPSIPHNEGLEVLKKQLDNFYEKSIPTEDLVKMAEFVLKNNYFEQLEQLLVRNLHHHMRVYI